MTAENGNGQLAQLVQIKRAYKKSVADLETELKTKYEQELSDGRRRLKGQYLENVVDTVFADSTPVKAVPGIVEPSVPAEPESPKCPECETPVAEGDKFCANCAAPLIDPLKEGQDDAPVVSTGRRFRARVRR
jgi:hypothetical protein